MRSAVRTSAPLARSGALLLGVVLLTTGCGSRVDREEHLALNSSVVMDESAAAAGADAGPRGSATAGRGASGAVPESPSAPAATSPPDPAEVASGEAESDGGSGDEAADDQATAPPAGGAPTSGPATLSPVTVGNIGTYSGIAGAILAPGQEALQVWAAWANEQGGGLGGHQINLITRDDAGDPSRAQSLVRDMIENQGAIAMISNLTVFTTANYVPILEQHQVPEIGGDIASFDYFESPMLFPHGADIGVAALGSASFGVQAGNTNVGIIFCSDSPTVCGIPARVIEQDAKSRLGADVVYSASASLAQPDFTSECLAARDAGVDNLVVWTDGNSVRRTADSCANQGYTPFMAANTIALTEAVLQSPNTNGLVAASQLFPAVANDTPGAKQFQQAYADYAGKAPQAGPAAINWAAGRLAQKAAAASFTEEQPTAQDMLDGLYTIKGETLDGLTVPLTFGPDGLRDIPPCFFRVEVQDQKFVAPKGSQTTCL